ncbi:MAG: type III pantothenate kinase, partial [Zetaproteobacteria bacterium]
MVFGLYAGEQLLGRWRLSSKRHGTADELAWQLHGMFNQWGQSTTDIAGIIAASVVPQVDPTLAEACQRICGRSVAFVGSDEIRTGMAIDYKHPREVGADRIVNAVAAHARHGAPVIVLDCGTATTFDVVSPAGHYAGGLILPGIEVACEALSARAAKLPAFSPQPVPFGIGRDTISSMQIGSYWGTIAALDGIIERLCAMPGYGNAPIVATGGLSR